MLQFLVMVRVMLARPQAYREALDLRELDQVSRRKRCRPLQRLTRRWRHCCQSRVSSSISGCCATCALPICSPKINSCTTCNVTTVDLTLGFGHRGSLIAKFALCVIV